MLDLPEALDERLESAPLSLVVWQMRYPRKLVAAEVGVGLAIQQALGGPDVWQLDQAQSQLVVALALSQIKGGSAIPTTADTHHGWRLQSGDGAWTITVLPESVGLETTRYDSWADFSGRLEVLLKAIKKTVNPDAEERLGLRYINRIEEPRVASPAEWAKWIRPEVLGVVQHPGFRPGVIATQQQVDLKAAGGLSATLRHGLFREENSPWLTYVVDIDTYRSGVRAFDQGAIVAAAQKQNELARQVFQSVITPDMYAYFRGEDQ